MEHRIKGSVGWYGGLTKSVATKKGNKGSRPHCGMERVGKVECSMKDEKMFYGHWGMQWALIAGAILFCSCAAHRDPVVITTPWSMVNDVPSMNAGQPGLDCIPGNFASVLTNEGTEDGPESRHPMGLEDGPSVTELDEVKDASAVCSLSFWGVKRAD